MSAANLNLNSNSTPTKDWWIFLAGLAIFILFQTGLVLEVQLTRVLPPEADDAYCYIYNAIQLRQGFNYNTPALKDLQSQAQKEPGDSVYRQNLKWELHHSLFFTHYILHSTILLVISWITGVSLETAYKISCVVGSLLIAGALSYFLLTITERISAGLALGSLALTMFPMQGIHYVVPTNISMALGLILLSFVLRTRGHTKWILFFLSLICLSIHRTGVIYASLGVFTSAFFRYKEENRKQLILDLLPTLIIIGFYVLFTHIYPFAIFRLSPMAPPPDTYYFKEVWLNLIELFKLFGQWFLNHGVVTGPQPIQNFITHHWISFLGFQILGLVLLTAPWLMKKSQEEKYRFFRWILSFGGAMILLPSFSIVVIIFILRTGWLYPPSEKKSYLYYAFFLFLFLLFLSLLHVMYIAEPGHPILRADLTNRVWVPFAVVLAAIFAQGLWRIFLQLYERTYNFLPEKVTDYEVIKKGLKPLYLWTILITFLVVGYTNSLVRAYSIRENIKYLMIIRQNVIFDKDQVRIALEKTRPQDFIIYDDSLIRHYFLCHGGLRRRAIYLPLQPFPDNFNPPSESNKYKIGWNPFLAVQNYENVRAIHYPLIIPGDSTLILTLDPQVQLENVQILPGLTKTGGESPKLRVKRQSATGVIEQIDIQITEGNWQNFPIKPLQGGSLFIINLDPSQPFLLSGLNLGKQQDYPFLWPWQGVDKVTLIDNQIRIERSVSLPRCEKLAGTTYDLEVVQDAGSTVLWRLRPRDKGKSQDVES